MMMKIEVKRERESERGKKTKEGACSGGISSFVYIYEKKGSQGGVELAEYEYVRRELSVCGFFLGGGGSEIIMLPRYCCTFFRINRVYVC